MEWGCVFIFLTPKEQAVGSVESSWQVYGHQKTRSSFFALPSAALASWLQTDYCDAGYHIHILGGRHRVCLVAK